LGLTKNELSIAEWVQGLKQIFSILAFCQAVSAMPLAMTYLILKWNLIRLNYFVEK